MSERISDVRLQWAATHPHAVDILPSEAADMAAELLAARAEIARYKESHAELLLTIFDLEWNQSTQLDGPAFCTYCHNEEADGHKVDCTAKEVIDRARRLTE